MKYKRMRVYIFIFIFLQTIIVAGQDTVRYCRSNSPWISNCYSFYKLNNQSSGGTFEQFMNSDDGQHWYGKGKFTEYKNKIIVDSYKSIRSIYVLYSSDSLLTLSRRPIITDSSIVRTHTFHKRRGYLYTKRGSKRKIIYKKVVKENARSSSNFSRMSRQYVCNARTNTKTSSTTLPKTHPCTPRLFPQSRLCCRQTVCQNL